jgi:hypothetical protein
VPADVRALIRTMAQANPRWGAPRIHGELLKLGIGTLHLAHTTKKVTQKDKRAGLLKPFGSIFWHNSARMTWHVEAVLKTADTKGIRWTCCKANLGARPAPQTVSIQFGQAINLRHELSVDVGSERRPDEEVADHG